MEFLFSARVGERTLLPILIISEVIDLEDARARRRSLAEGGVGVLPVPPSLTSDDPNSPLLLEDLR